MGIPLYQETPAKANEEKKGIDNSNLFKVLQEEISAKGRELSRELRDIRTGIETLAASLEILEDDIENIGSEVFLNALASHCPGGDR
ncbi:hypothetical protein N7466_009226 [Penicillium verhagenii]|uniref:uncharacterized protein n=1 Tax=Penicillium verhagenii TaxID=1562060 RepID=UPI0025457431|nr:uncharacterized protein N7466_009226 [Penicillium verhagenii]KAJ5920900.1 hypothetical protein N7466_009226 [Penicillium verhagenii]